jgi:hypothetical protein
MENALATFSASTVTTILLLAASTLFIQGMDKYASSSSLYGDLKISCMTYYIYINVAIL